MGGTQTGMGEFFTVKKTLHPDFCDPTTGKPIEVKRPGEKESHKGQKNNYAKCDPSGADQCDCVPEDCRFDL